VTPKRLLLLVTLVYLLLAGIATSALAIKRDSLSFHARDYSYFIEQAARLADPRLSDRLALNLEGFNFIGLRGTEGALSIYHAIHAEYFRYTYSLLYFLTASTTVIYLFYSLIFFFPLLYFALLPHPRREEWQPALLLGLLYVLVPAALPSMTYDLRPRMLFIPAWTLLALAIAYRRPFGEKLLFALCLVAIREEGMVFVLAGAMFNFVRMSFPAGVQRGRWTQMLVLSVLCAAGMAAFLAFMNWGGYQRIDGSADPIAALVALWNSGVGPLLAIAAGLGLAGAAVWAARQPARRPTLALVLAYGIPAGLVGFQALRDIMGWWAAQNGAASLWDLWAHTLSAPQSSLALYVLVVGLFLGWAGCAGRARRALTWGLAGLCALFALTTLFTLPVQVQSWLAARQPAQLVWDFKAGMDPYATRVLVDYDTYQAFYNVEHVYVYNRLPLWLVDAEDRYYPANKLFLAKLLRDEVGYAVIARGSEANVLEVAQMAGLAPEEIAANEGYVVLKMR
jgi:hypothetical protein